MPQFFDPSVPLDAQELYRRRAQGEVAGQSMGADSRAMAAALRRSQTELPEVLGQGHSSVAASPLNAVATLMQRIAGRRDIADLKAQADVLRGQTEAGLIAKMQQEEQQRKLKREQEEADALLSHERAQENMIKQSEMQAQNSLKLAMQKGEIQDERLASARQNIEMINPETGKVELLEENPNTGELYRDGELVENKSQWRKYQKKNEDKSGVSGLGKIEKREYTKNKQQILTLGRVKRNLDRLNDSDRQYLAQHANDVLSQTLPPVMWRQYVKDTFRNASPRVRSYLLSLENFDAERRHDLYGAALTGTELSEAQKTMISAAGVDMDERALRAQEMVDAAVDSIRALESKGEDFISDLTIPVFYEHPEDTQKKGSEVDAEILSLESELQSLKEQEAELMRQIEGE